MLKIYGSVCVHKNGDCYDVEYAEDFDKFVEMKIKQFARHEQLSKEFKEGYAMALKEMYNEDLLTMESINQDEDWIELMEQEHMGDVPND